MAINATVYDLENYPENSKTVTLDLLKVVPVGEQGDEKFILTCKTSAYANFTSKTVIGDLFIQEFLCGWAKSSGFKGAVFTITSSNNKMWVKIDNTTATGGVATAGYYEIVLSTGTGITSDAIAADIQTKLRALTMETDDTSKALGYTNSRCSFVNSRFIIKSGTISKLLSGDAASSVEISTNVACTANTTLGFDWTVDSKTLAGTDIREVVASVYTAGEAVLNVTAGLDYSPGDSMYITDGANGDYFTAISGTDIAIQVTTSGGHGIDGITNSYLDGAKVQKLRYNDPEYSPKSCLSSVDDALTWGILSLANQIDFSG